MGTFTAKVSLAHPEKPERRQDLELLVDTGSTFTKVSKAVLRDLGIRPSFRVQALTADQREVTREVGLASITVDGRSAVVHVAFGEPQEITVVGATTLEVLGLTVDTIAKKLIPRPVLEK